VLTWRYWLKRCINSSTDYVKSTLSKQMVCIRLVSSVVELESVFNWSWLKIVGFRQKGLGFRLRGSGRLGSCISKSFFTQTLGWLNVDVQPNDTDPRTKQHICRSLAYLPAKPLTFFIWCNLRYVRSTRCRTYYSRCIIWCSHG